MQRIDPRELLRDSMQIIVIGRGGKLEPIRVQVDSGEIVPHWIEEGDSMVFRAANEITFRGWLNRAAVRIEGEDWPMDARDDQGRLTVSRPGAIVFLDSVKNRDRQ
jgi:hypothetical protein